MRFSAHCLVSCDERPWNKKGKVTRLGNKATREEGEGGGNCEEITRKQLLSSNRCDR